MDCGEESTGGLGVSSLTYSLYVWTCYISLHMYSILVSSGIALQTANTHPWEENNFTSRHPLATWCYEKLESALWIPKKTTDGMSPRVSSIMLSGVDPAARSLLVKSLTECLAIPAFCPCSTSADLGVWLRVPSRLWHTHHGHCLMKTMSHSRGRTEVLSNFCCRKSSWLYDAPERDWSNARSTHVWQL